MMRSGCAEGEISDQARVYEYIVQRLESGNYLRLMVQARRAQTALRVCAPVAGIIALLTFHRHPLELAKASCSQPCIFMRSGND